MATILSAFSPESYRFDHRQVFWLIPISGCLPIHPKARGVEDSGFTFPKMLIRKNEPGITAAGTAPEFNRIPYYSETEPVIFLTMLIKN